MRHERAVAPALLFLIAVACDAGAPSARSSGDGDASAAWDSAGAWTVAPEPAVAIGAAEGEPEYQLYRDS